MYNEENQKWTYDIWNSDIWTGGICDSKEEAIELAKDEAIENNKYSFRVGKVEKAFDYGIDVDVIIEDIQNSTYDECGEVAENYLEDVTKEDKEELSDKLDKVFREWQEQHNYKPNFYTISDEEEIQL